MSDHSVDINKASASLDLPKIDIYGGKDPRDIPNYTIPDVAHIVGVTVSTLRSWMKNRPLILKPDPESSLLSFTNITEAYMLATLRLKHRLAYKKIRPAVKYLKEDLKIEHPLRDMSFETDDEDLFIRHYDKVINASRQGQIVIPETVEIYLNRVERDESGREKRYFPLLRSWEAVSNKDISREPRAIMVDPRVYFGKPVLTESGIPTAAIISRWKAGDSIGMLSKDFEIKPSQVETALRYESLVA